MFIGRTAVRTVKPFCPVGESGLFKILQDIKDKKMSNTIWLTTQTGQLMAIYKDVAREKGLKSGDRLKSDSQFWDVLRANAQYGIASCEIKLGKISFPSELETEEK